MIYSTGPTMGVGISYMNAIGAEIEQNIDKIDFIEAYTERFFISENNKRLEKIIKDKPLVLHGLDLSLGTPGEIENQYLDRLVKVVEKTNCEWYSDHLSLTKIDEIEVGHLMPIVFSEENICNIVCKIKLLQNNIRKPFLLENITYYYNIPGANYKEEEFINRILNAADCGMLLDLNNLYLNSINHGYDPFEFLHSLPLERVVEIHLAGGSFKENMHVDTHANAISDEVWKLFDYVSRICNYRGVIIERDANFHPFVGVIKEIELAREIMLKHYKIRKQEIYA